jgi:hypothetical protein
MVGFVDDSTGQFNDLLSDTVTSLDELIKMMAHDAQLWNDLPHISGGLQEVSKCSYHILYFSYPPNGLSYTKGSSTAPPLELKDSSGEQIHVKCKSAYESHKTLRHFKSPDGTAKTHIKILTTKGSVLSRQLATSSMTRAQAFLFYWLFYVSAIHYSLPQCFFTEKALHTAQSKSLLLILEKCGYMRPMSLLALGLCAGTLSKVKDRSCCLLNSISLA